MTQKRPKYYSPPAVRQRAKELRWQMTPAETALWEQLKNKQLYGLKFRRQHPLHHFILDFYCHAHQLVVEVDGGIHHQQQDYDAARTEWLTQHSFKVIRFTNDEVLTSMDTVLQKIAQVCGVDTSQNPPDPPTGGESIPPSGRLGGAMTNTPPPPSTSPQEDKSIPPSGGLGGAL